MATQSTAVYDIMLKHRKRDYTQFVRKHRYRAWQGKSINSIIQIDDGLTEDGDTCRLHFTDTPGS